MYGELRQSSVLQHGDMVFNCGKLVSYISHHMALKPGDVSFTGTREDVIPAIPKTNRCG
jgi:2-keto-4-pentenoate hydratase/2-oxohepta-3-ene-1,7-dioic acid hydratase in catechol pathway